MTNSDGRIVDTWTGPTFSARWRTFSSVVTGDVPSMTTMFGTSDVTLAPIPLCTAPTTSGCQSSSHVASLCLLASVPTLCKTDTVMK